VHGGCLYSHRHEERDWEESGAVGPCLRRESPSIRDGLGPAPPRVPVRWAMGQG
jgi:hypothetical protein